MSLLFDSLATTDVLADVFSDASLIAAMLRFEVAIAGAQARAGLIPADAARAIAAAAADAQAFDAAAIARRARASGTIALSFVEELTGRVRAVDPEAATFVHWGITSQDVVDTALVLCLARARAGLDADHHRLVNALRRLSDRHAGTVMLGRTLLQPAPPITFGLKAAGWYAACARSWVRVSHDFENACVVQLGGAVGTLAALGERGPGVAADVAQALGLPNPEASWHTHRDRLAALVASCGVYAGSLGKVARDVTLLMQHEVSEAGEPGGGSSTLPHKRNPARCAAALAAAVRVPPLVSAFLAGMVQEHERGVGGWHAEAPTLVAVIQTTGAALAAVADVAEGLHVDPERMRANLTATRGVVFAERAMILLTPRAGREPAQRWVAEALEAVGQSAPGLASALRAHPDAGRLLSPAELSELENPEGYLGAAEELRRRLLST